MTLQSALKTTILFIISLINHATVNKPVAPPDPTARSNECSIPSKYASSNGTADDSPAVLAAFVTCNRNAVIHFGRGVDYNILTPIKATNLNNVMIHMQGNLHLPRDIMAVQKVVSGSVESALSKPLYWFEFAGPGIDFLGNAYEDGWIYSYGQAWWDANPTDATGLALRPQLMSLNTTYGSLQHFKSRQPIAGNVRLIGSNIAVTDAIIDARSNSSKFPFNTFGFAVSGANISLTNSVIFNGDYAIAIQPDSHNINFDGATIGFASRGMTIGPIGEDPNVFASISNIRFNDVTLIDSLYAANIRTWAGGQGLIKDVSWSNIRNFNVTFPIFVTQAYSNPNGKQHSGKQSTSDVLLEGVSFKEFSGTINTFHPGDGSCVTDPCWYNVGWPGLTHTEYVIFNCSTELSCRNITTANIWVYPENGETSKIICVNLKRNLNPTLGFPCGSG
ncbi:putative exopolygalacturonase [Venustampulla echinocandica]|uniref:galacturonan 1,4-alpha-galacturonidase n=1 Tax=Venustampulla echinocandica TaxID=2656787 RepID=A0A370TQF7_9HELO|nr:putative exopolygalacturonase [Venustampulla echinocandica]RDL37742.1 putative exopolygalacturonase [Venustampulla echinocandica]